MKLPAFELEAPDRIAEACRLLSGHNGDARIISGGTELLPAMKNRLKTPRLLVSLERIRDLNDIRYDSEKGLTLGSLVTLRDLASNEAAVRHYPLIPAAARTVGGAQLQAMGTVGGNLCQDCCCIYYNRPPMLRAGWKPCHKLGGTVCHAVKKSPECWAAYSGDLAPALLALDARVTVAAGNGLKTVPLRSLYSGNGISPLALTPGEIVTAVHVPPPGGSPGGAYLKLRMRKAIDYPLLGVAAVVTLKADYRTCQTAGLALTGVATRPLLIEATAQLQGQRVGKAMLQGLADAAHEKARPVANALGFSPRYRKEMVRVYVTQAFERALAVAGLEGGAI